MADGTSEPAGLIKMDEQNKILILEWGPYISFVNCFLPYHLDEVITNREKFLLDTPEAMLNIDSNLIQEATTHQWRTNSKTQWFLKALHHLARNTIEINIELIYRYYRRYLESVQLFTFKNPRQFDGFSEFFRNLTHLIKKIFNHRLGEIRILILFNPDSPFIDMGSGQCSLLI